MKVNSLVYKSIIYPLVFLVNRLSIRAKILELNVMDSNLFASIAEIQQSKYAKLINHAFNKTNYYNKTISRMYSLNPDISLVSNMPILTKEIVRENNTKNLTTKCKNYVSRMTAGTTGTPVTVFVDREALAWQLATRYYLFGWHGISVGDREARFWGRPLHGVKYLLKDMLLNRKRFTFCGCTNAKLLEEYESLIKFEPDYFYGYSSLILRVAIVCDDNKLEVPKLKSIICTAEMLSNQQRKFIESVFKCPVVIEYGCTESDIIAFECEYGKLHVMSHNVLVEANPNDSGVVYTDLNNIAMPLIRYELGDNIEIEKGGTCKCRRNLPIISRLEGRTISQILTLPDGTSMHAVKFAYLIEDICSKGVDLLQFKILHENNALVFFVNIIGDYEIFDKEMRHEIDKILNGRIDYSIRYGAIQPSINRKFSYFEQK